MFAPAGKRVDCAGAIASERSRRLRGSPGRRAPRDFALLLALAACLVAGPGGGLPARAAPGAASPPTAREVEARRQRLEDLRARVQALNRQIERAEASQGEAADALRETEQAISDTQRRLQELRDGSATLIAEVDALEREISARGRRLEAQLALLGRLAVRQAVGAHHDSLRVFLSGGDPNLTARRLYALRRLIGARGEVVNGLRGEIAELEEASRERRDRRRELAALEQEEIDQRRNLESQRDRHAAMLTRIAATVAKQRRELATLQRDEARLTRLLEQLARILERAAARLPGHPPGSSPGSRGERAAPAVGFAALKGRLEMPVPGELANHFGGPRLGGGPAWKGIFIRTPAGTPVKVVGDGEVVFAEWLRGFGNLLIVDHGGGYMSLYGNNESLLRTVGAEVRKGEAIATSGRSGGVEESGLYFEIRHEGRATDPLGWVAR